MKINLFVLVLVIVSSFFLNACCGKKHDGQKKVTQTDNHPENKNSSGVKKENISSVAVSKIKEISFVDEKGVALFGGKKAPLKAGQVEFAKDAIFTLVTDENGRWKIELESKIYSIDEALNHFDEGNLYPISEESLKELNAIILSKVKP